MWEEKTDLQTGEKYYYNVVTSERRSLAAHDYGEEIKGPRRSVNIISMDSSTQPTTASSLTTGTARPRPYAYYTGEYKRETTKKKNHKPNTEKKKTKTARRVNSSKVSPKKSRRQHIDDDFQSSSDDRSYDIDDDEVYFSSLEDEDDSDDHRRFRAKRTSRSTRSNSRTPSRITSRSKRSRSASKSDGLGLSLSFRDDDENDDDDDDYFEYMRRKGQKKSYRHHLDEEYRTRKDKNNSYRDHLEEDYLGSERTSSKRSNHRGRRKHHGTQDDDDDKNHPHQQNQLRDRAAMSTSVLLQLEQQRRIAEAHQKQARHQGKALAKERETLAKERKALAKKRVKDEEDIRQLKQTLELEQRELLEKEEQGRINAVDTETNRQVKEAERRALKAAKEAEKARKKAEKEMERSRQKAAELETARIKAEQEAEIVRHKLAMEEEARRQAEAEVIRTKREAEARIQKLDQDIQASSLLLTETAGLLRDAERLAMLDAQKQHEADLAKRQQAAMEEEARRQAHEEAIRAKEVAARIQKLDQEMEASSSLLIETADLLRDAERLAMLDAQKQREADLAKRRKAAMEEEARRQAPEEAIRAKEVAARIQKLDQEMEASSSLLIETADLLRDAERLAMLDAQKQYGILVKHKEAAMGDGVRRQAHEEAARARRDVEARIQESDRRVEAANSLVIETAERLREAERLAMLDAQQQQLEAKLMSRDTEDTMPQRTVKTVTIRTPQEQNNDDTDSSEEYGFGDDGLYRSVSEMAEMKASFRINNHLADSSSESGSEEEDFNPVEGSMVGREHCNEPDSDKDVDSSYLSDSGESSSEETESSVPQPASRNMGGSTNLHHESTGRARGSSVPDAAVNVLERSMDLEDIFGGHDSASTPNTPSASMQRDRLKKKNTSASNTSGNSNMSSQSGYLDSHGEFVAVPIPKKRHRPTMASILSGRLLRHSPSGGGGKIPERGVFRTQAERAPTTAQVSLSPVFRRALSGRGMTANMHSPSRGAGKIPVRGVVRTQSEQAPTTAQVSLSPVFRRALSGRGMTANMHSPSGGAGKIPVRGVVRTQSERAPTTDHVSLSPGFRRALSGRGGMTANTQQSSRPDQGEGIERKGRRRDGSRWNMSRSRTTDLEASRVDMSRNDSRMSNLDASRLHMSRMNSRISNLDASRKHMSRMNSRMSNLDASRMHMSRTTDFDRSFASGGPRDVESQVTPKKKKERFERPPKTLVLIWLLMAGELGFDMGTTVISFHALLKDDDCCGDAISMGPVPMGITAPFFLLIGTEIALLLRVILLTVAPQLADLLNERHDSEGNIIYRSTFMRYLCCCLRWKINILMKLISLLVLLNPFLSCVIAWILLYQSNKKGAFMVLGFEGASLTLHYISVYLEGAVTNLCTFVLHGVLPLIPFVAAIGLTLFYLKQGGVCYIVDNEMFKFNGCEICLDGYPPVDGLCHFQNGTTYPFEEQNVLLGLAEVRAVEDLLARTTQVSYCSRDNPDGPDVDFCFFDFEDGKLPSVIPSNVTKINAKANSNKCGATVGPGVRLTQCTKYLWTHTKDPSMPCRTGGGPGDPCQLSITHDGNDQGRSKDPSRCVQDLNGTNYRSYGDTFFLWDEPTAYDKDYQWTGFSWLLDSSSRWVKQLQTMREGGVRVASPSVRYSSSDQVMTDFQRFFGACQPNCLNENDVSHIDILAVSVFCDPNNESCETKATNALKAIKRVSAEYGNKAVYITSWGVLDSTVSSKLKKAMEATSSFFAEGSPVERVYWYGGSEANATNLALGISKGSNSSLGELWTSTCRKLS